MSTPLELIVEAFDTSYDLHLSDEEHAQYNQYIDLLIQQKKIIKHGKYDFTGEGLAIIINDGLEDIQSWNRVTALQSNDVRIDTRVKGQGVYFLITSKKGKEEVAILSWGTNAITFWPVKNTGV